MWACSSGELGKVESMLHDETGNLNAHDGVGWSAGRGRGERRKQLEWSLIATSEALPHCTLGCMGGGIGRGVLRVLSREE